MTIDKAEADVAEAERQWPELLCWCDYYASIAHAEARYHGALGWSVPGVGLWVDRQRAGAVGRRWLALYELAWRSA